MSAPTTSVALPPDEILEEELEAKATATLIEKLQAAGHDVHAGKAGDFTVSRWGMSRHCQDFESLQSFAQQVGAH